MPRKNHVFLDFHAALARLEEGETAALERATLSALSGANKKDVAALAQTWLHLPIGRRRRIAQSLFELAEQNFELDFDPIFRYLLSDDDAQVRAKSIAGLWEDEDPNLIKPFVGFLRSDPDAEVRASAAEALGRFLLLGEYGRLPKTPQADLIRDALFATICSGAEEIAVRCRAVEALAYSSEAGVRDVIANAYADDDAQMRISAVTAMGRSADEYWRGTVAGELHSPDPQMRFQAARAAGELEDRSAAPRLVEMLDDPDREVQSAAIGALGQIGGPLAKDALTRAASSDDEVLRELADEALRELEFSNSSEFLLFDMELDDEHLDDEDRVDETDDG